MKRTIAVVAVLVLGVLAVIQLGSDALFGRAAAAGSLPSALPHGLGTRIYAVLGTIPFPAFLRRTAAQAAIDDRDFARAQALIDELARGVDRDDLQGRLFDAQDDHARAAASFITAGDLVRVGNAVDALQHEGHLIAALQMQRALVAELERMDETGSLAHAYWRLAQLESANGEHPDSLASYNRAVALEPLSETYLLGAANEAMEDGDLPAAAASFERVVEVDPGSVDGVVGVGRVAVRSGNIQQARREAALAARLAPGPTYQGLAILKREIQQAEASAPGS